MSDLSKSSQGKRSGARSDPPGQSNGVPDYGGIVDRMGLPLFTIDQDHSVQVWNRAAEELYGFPRPDVTGKDIFEIIVPPGQKSQFRAIFNSVDSEHPWSGEIEVHHSNGSQIPVQLTLTYAPEGGVQAPSIVGVAYDIRTERQTRQVLKRAAELHRVVLSEVSEAVFICDLTGEFTYICPNCEFIFGYTQEEIAGRGKITALLPDLPFSIDAFTDKIDVHNLEMEIVDKYDTRRVLLVSCRSVEIEQGRHLFTCREITERHDIQQSLKRSEERYRTLAEAVTDLITITDLDASARYVSPSILEVLGYTQDEVKDISVYDLVHPDDVDQVRTAHQELLSHRDIVRLEHRLRRKDESYVWVETSARKIVDDITDEPKEIVSVTREISERKRIEDRLRETNESLRSITAQMVHLQEKERRKLAYELHDRISQDLSHLQLKLREIQPLIAESTSEQSLADTLSAVEALTKRIRSLSDELHPKMLDELGLEPAVNDLISQIRSSSDLRISCSVTLKEAQLPLPIKNSAFRIVRELIENTRQHANASEINLDISVSDGMVQIRCFDDGEGFDVEQTFNRAREGDTIGLLAIRERAKRHDGVFEIRSEPGHGTDILVTLSLK